jgi:hypothetical protein
MAFWQGLRIWKMNRLVKNGQPVPEWLSRLMEETCVLLPVRAPQIVLVRGISTPLLWAWGRPMLLWPAELSEQLSPEARRGVILHELAHLKRRDHWVGRLELVAGCLWWPNPLFWYVRHHLRENAELACDAWVVQTLPNGRRDYADALLTVCQNYSHPAVPLPALGMGKSTRRTLERRLTIILRDRVPFRVSWWGMIAVLLLGFLTLPGWSQSKKESPQLPEVESKDDAINVEADPAAGINAGDELAVPAAGIGEDRIKVPVVTKTGRQTIVIQSPPVKKADTTDSVVSQKQFKVEVQEELLGIEVVFPKTGRVGLLKDFLNDGKQQNIEYFLADTPHPTRNRDRRLQEIESKLQALLGELRELRGKKDATFTPQKAATITHQPPKVVERPITLSGFVRRLTGVAQQQDLAKAELAKAQAARRAALRQKEVEAKPAEVVETKTITLVQTTYNLSRFSGELLAALLKAIIKADVLQIQFSTRQQIVNAAGISVVAQTITLITTPETQEYIGRLIGLIEKAPRKKFRNRQNPATKGILPVNIPFRDFDREQSSEFVPDDQLKSNNTLRKR